MSFCYDFQKWIIVSLAMVTIIGLQYTYGFFDGNNNGIDDKNESLEDLRKDLNKAQDNYGVYIKEDNQTSRVDKLINDTKQEVAKENQYKTELINRIQNSTCLSEVGQFHSGYFVLYNDTLYKDSVVSKPNLNLGNYTWDLELLLQKCVKEGLIK